MQVTNPNCFLTWHESQSSTPKQVPGGHGLLCQTGLLMRTFIAPEPLHAAMRVLKIKNTG